ncbi:MAG: hypothetical protein CYPHOPRED_005465 [Cyphobasidiales sp. Tagirdzhanova-0007]|nr:MAG: hypothetical protein CYPHOPRED_005465 [Cyphobasidiales sp. Tagirdzhanova-0007]
MSTLLRSACCVFGSGLALAGSTGLISRKSMAQAYGLPAEQTSNWILAVGIRDLCLGASLVYFSYTNDMRQAGLIGVIFTPVAFVDGFIAYTKGNKGTAAMHWGIGIPFLVFSYSLV